MSDQASVSSKERIFPTVLGACPFCGSDPQLHHGHGDITYILCEKCGAVVSFRPNLKGSSAVAAYNKRVMDISGVPA